jgi:two-component system, NtrC family, response regulator AtoC
MATDVYVSSSFKQETLEETRMERMKRDGDGPASGPDAAEASGRPLRLWEAVCAVTEDLLFVADADGRLKACSPRGAAVLGVGKSGNALPTIAECIDPWPGTAVEGWPSRLVSRNGQSQAGRLSAVTMALNDSAAPGWLLRFTPESTGWLDDAPEELVEFHGMVSRDAHMHRQFAIIRQVAATESTVLVRGESGTGKELVARALHLASERRAQPFLAVNCAALTPSLLESELFGHVRGAFTGASRDHAGVFARANRGTLFLDEVAELPIDLQAKLLRVLETQSFTPVGGREAVSVDVRIVAATHRSLRAMVRQGRFREDLMYRLRVVPIFLPPLRERRRDIPLLLWSFVARHNALGKRRITDVPGRVMRLLLDYPWPGNVRELANVVEYAFAVGNSSTLQLQDLPPEFREVERSPSQPVLPARSLVASLVGANAEQALRVEAALRESGGRLSEAARRLGLSRTSFWRLRRSLASSKDSTS